MSSFPTTHMDISGEVDMVALMDMLANMPEGERDAIMKETNKQMEQKMKDAKAASTREGLIENVLNARQQMRQLPSGYNVVTTTQSSNVKPPKRKIASLKECTPLTIVSMTIDTTHRQRYLCGKVAVVDSFRQINSICFLLEDIEGDLVRVSVYDTDRVFKLNEEIAIMEPFFKVAQDMIPVVRVDQPAEIVPWEAPATAQEWKQLGNDFVAAEDGRSAVHCYGCALDSTEIESERPALSTLYNNIAICESRLKRYHISVWYAGTAVYLDPENVKAWYRLVDSLMRYDLGACREVVKGAPSHPDIEKLAKKVCKSTTNSSDGHVFKGSAAWSNLVPTWSLAPGVQELKTSERDGLSYREMARAAFQKGNFERAKELYILELQGMRMLISSIAILSSNSSAAHVMMGQFDDAMLLSTVSIMLDKQNARPWIRRSNVLDHEIGPSAARKYLEHTRDDVSAAEEWDGKRSFIAKCSKEIIKLTEKERSQSKIKQVSDIGTEEQLEDRNTRQYGTDSSSQGIDEYIASMEDLLFRTKLIAPKMPTTGPVQVIIKKLAQRSCPKIHDEYPKHFGWPAGLNKVHTSKILYRGYLDSSLHPWNLSLVMSMGQYPVDEQMLLKRWHGPLGATLFSQRRHALRAGDVLDYRPKTEPMQYDPFIRSMFVNTPCNPLTRFVCGSVHVSIGFNDLGELLSSPVVPSSASSKNIECSSDNSEETLKFVGYEKSEFCIARSLVVQEMLLDPNTPMSSVFQVWYSAAWTKGTLKYFRLACKKALNTYNGRRHEDIVASYFHCWLSEEPLNPTESRKRWFDNVENHSCQKIGDTCSLKRIQDRVAALQYLLTGELIPADEGPDISSTSSSEGPSRGSRSNKNKKKKKKGKKSAASDNTKQTKLKREAADCGSLAFWNVPPNSAPLESDLFLNTVSYETIESLGGDNNKQNIIDILIQIKLRQLKDLRKKLLKGAITIDLRYGDVTQDNNSLLDEIASLSPKTASWSNLLDYSNNHYQSFHSIARHIKAKRHFGYSMNWIAIMYGGCLPDYLCENDTPMIERLLIEALKGEEDHQQQQILLVKPPHDTPLNLVGYVLSHKMKTRWINYFATSSSANSSNDVKVFNNRILKDYPFYRNSSAIFLEWKYE